jgi:hypothetical protein
VGNREASAFALNSAEWLAAQSLGLSGSIWEHSGSPAEWQQRKQLLSGKGGRQHKAKDSFGHQSSAVLLSQEQ